MLSGKEFVGLDVIKGWKEAGHDVQVAYLGWHDGRFLEKLNQMSIVSHPVMLGWYYISKPLWTLDSLIHYPRGLRSFLKVKRSFSPDIVYVDSYRQIITLYPFLKKNVIQHIHDPHSMLSTESRLLRIADKKTAKYVAVSHFIKEDLIKAGIAAEKIEVVHNGTTIPEGFEKEYMPHGKLRIGVVGQVLPRKGHEDVIKACAQLTDKISIEVLIYGSGDEQYIRYLKELIQALGLVQNVKWMGFEPDKTIVYNSLDVLVAATRNDEPFALVALEAGAHKVPVIATMSGGFPESIIDGKTGFIVPKNDILAIANKMLYYYENLQSLKDMGNAAYHNVSTHFSLRLMQQKMTALLAEGGRA